LRKHKKIPIDEIDEKSSEFEINSEESVS